MNPLWMCSGWWMWRRAPGALASTSAPSGDWPAAARSLRLAAWPPRVSPSGQVRGRQDQSGREGKWPCSGPSCFLLSCFSRGRVLSPSFVVRFSAELGAGVGASAESFPGAGGAQSGRWAGRCPRPSPLTGAPRRWLRSSPSPSAPRGTLPLA